MTGGRAAAALLALALVGGCEFDLVEVDGGRVLRPPRPATLSLHLLVPERGRPLELHAWFHPGIDGRGEVREVVEDSLRVDGAAFAPAASTEQGALHYRIVGLDAAGPPRAVRPPPVKGAGVPPAFPVEPLRVEGPDTLVAPPGGVLELRVAGAQQATDGAWRVGLLRDGCHDREFLSLAGPTPPPSPLRVPVELFPADFRQGFLRLQASAHRAAAGPDPSYQVAISSSIGACIPVVVR